MNPKKKVLVTGAGGFLGFYIARDLIKNNYEVHSFARSHYKKLEALGVIQHQGDLSNISDIENSLTGIEAVFHCASKVGMNGSEKDFYKVNVLGTQNLIQAMKKLGIKILVYTSTPSVIFGETDLINVNEDTPYPDKFLSTYAKTKMQAEKLVRAASSETFFTISLRPHLIFGPGDQNLIPRLLDSRKKNKLKIIGSGKNKVDVLYVENASYAHLLAFKALEANPALNGKVYFIGQGPVVLWDFINQILSLSKLSPVTQKIPLVVAYFIGAIIEFVLFLTQQKDVHPPMSRFIAMQLGKSHFFNHHNATCDLGFKPLYSIEEGLKKTIDQEQHLQGI